MHSPDCKKLSLAGGGAPRAPPEPHSSPRAPSWCRHRAREGRAGTERSECLGGGHRSRLNNARTGGRRAGLRREGDGDGEHFQPLGTGELQTKHLQGLGTKCSPQGQNAAPRSEAAPGEGMGSKREAEDGNPQLLPQGARGGTKRLDLLLMGNLAPK